MRSRGETEPKKKRTATTMDYAPLMALKPGDPPWVTGISSDRSASNRVRARASQLARASGRKFVIRSESGVMKCYRIA